ncbi:MAG: glutamine synthetase type III, partial [Bacteroidota bacterium]
AIVNVLRKYIKDSKKVRFEGDGYSEDWVNEAEKRGLENVKDTPRALDAYLTEKARKTFKEHNVLSDVELEARNEISWESYIMKIQIESRVMGDLILNHIIPTAINYQNKLIQNANGLKGLGIDNKEVLNNIKKITDYIDMLNQGVHNMTEERKRINKLEDTREKAIAYCDDVKGKYFDDIRYAVDKLELLIDDEDWPLVKYREMLFLR